MKVKLGVLAVTRRDLQYRILTCFLERWKEHLLNPFALDSITNESSR